MFRFCDSAEIALELANLEIAATWSHYRTLTKVNHGKARYRSGCRLAAPSGAPPGTLWRAVQRVGQPRITPTCSTSGGATGMRARASIPRSSADPSGGCGHPSSGEDVGSSTVGLRPARDHRWPIHGPMPDQPPMIGVEGPVPVRLRPHAPDVVKWGTVAFTRGCWPCPMAPDIRNESGYPE